MSATNEQTQANSAPTAPARRHILLPLLVSAGIILLLAVVALLSLRATLTFPADLSVYAPADSIAYLSVDLRPLIARAKEFDPAIQAWKESSAIAKVREDLSKGLRGQGIDLQQDILSWTGPVLALAITDLPDFVLPSRPSMPFATQVPRPPAFLAILTARDSRQARRSLSSLASKNKMQREQESYEGVEISLLRGPKMPEDLAYAVADNLVFISNRANHIRAAIDRIQGRGSRLSEAEAYKNPSLNLSSAAQERVLVYFVNFRGLEKMMAGKGLLPPGGISPLQSFKYLDSLGGSVTLSPEMLEVESVSWGRNQASDPARKVLSSLPPVGKRAFEFLPKDSACALALQSPAAYWRLLKNYLSTNAIGKPFDLVADAKKELKQSTGLDLEEDILGWMSGELALGVFDVTPKTDKTAPGVLPVQITLVIEDRDPATLQAKLANLRATAQKLLSSQGSFPVPSAWVENKSKGFTSHSLVMPGLPFSLTLGQADRIAFVSSSPTAFGKNIAAGRDAQNSVISNPAFQRLRPLLPRKPIVLFFAEPARFAPILPERGAADLISSLKVIAAGEEFLPQGARSITHLEMDFPQFIRALDTIKEAAANKTSKVRCLSNQEQIANAIFVFANDHNGALPDASRWVEEITPYLSNPQVLRCPEDHSGAKCSYAMNAELSGKKLSEVPQPEFTVLIFETAHPGDSPSGGPGQVAGPPRHSEGNCFAFADGHAKIYKETPPFSPPQ